jgi:hypothetical protein
MSLTSFSTSISEHARRAHGWLGGILAGAVVVLFLALATESCKDSGSTAPPLQPGGPALTSAPPSATVSSGTSQTVSITGGQAPYTMSQLPVASLASAVWVDSAHTPASLTVFGAATVATGSTSVIIRDSSPSATRSVTIPIIKN